MKRIKQISRGLALFLAAILLAGFWPEQKANAAAEPEVVLAGSVAPFTVNAGGGVTVKVPVKTINDGIENPIIGVDLGDAPLKVTSEFKMSRENYSSPPADLSRYDKTYIQFDLKADDLAPEKAYKIYLTFQFVYSYFDESDLYVETVKDYKMKTPIEISVVGAKSGPSVVISDFQSNRSNMKPKDSFELTGAVKNNGESPAKNVEIWVDGFAGDGILPDYTTGKRNTGTLAAGASVPLSYPVTVSEDATDGVKTLTLHVAYTDAAGEKKEETSGVYVTVRKEKQSGSADLVIKDVRQSPNVPMAKGRLKLTFTIENKGKSDARAVKVTPTNLANTNFSPARLEPYKYIKTIKAGTEKKIVMNFIVSDKVTEGLNEIQLAITYKNSKGEEKTIDGNKLYVLNVKNPEDPVLGVPKLIISDFSALSDEGNENLRAGSTFNFSFDIFNTHSNLSADNIKVTLSSEENSFSVAEGSSSFYINRIQPGETVHKEIKLRIKPDCVTKAYPLKIDFEYEYEGMQKLENEISTGLKVNETLNLQVLENSRPTVSNIQVGTWEAPQIGLPCNMDFEFRNMGKSTLYNVTARIESTDFSSTQQNVFIGNVDAGGGDVYSMELTPNVENADGAGKLIVTYEDSNGNSYDMSEDFSAFVGSPVIDGGGMGEGMIPPEEEMPVKKPILPAWAFVIVQVVLFLAGILIVRKTVIAVYRSRLRKKEEE